MSHTGHAGFGETTGRRKPGRRRAAATMQRDAEALRMHLAGLTYQQIAAQLGWRSVASAYDAVRRSIADTARLPHADAVKAEEERLGMLTRVLTRIAADPSRGASAVTDACMALLRVSESRRKLLGLDPPPKHRVEVITEDMIEQLIANMERENNEAEARIAAIPPRAIGG